jgi:hypothetical protein
MGPKTREWEGGEVRASVGQVKERKGCVAQARVGGLKGEKSREMRGKRRHSRIAGVSS